MNYEHENGVGNNPGNDMFIDVERVIASKNPGLLKIVPRFIIRYLKRVIHQEEINRFIRDNNDKKGLEFSKAILTNFGIAYNVRGLDDIPLGGRYVFASNHPLGGMDGIAFLTAVGERFTDIKFPVNDILMNIKGLDNIFVPVNKHGGHPREAVEVIEAAYSSNAQVLMFPAGLVSRKQKGVIKDLDWKSSFIKKAIQHQRDVVPVHITGRNSNFFYNLANWRKRLGIKANIEMLYLADEFYKIKDKNLTITFGAPVSWGDLKNGPDPLSWAQKCRELSYSLEK